MKIVITSEWNEVLSDLKERMKELGWIMPRDVLDADRFILWNDVMKDAIDYVNLAHSFQIPVITIQHGRYGTSRYEPPFNQKIISDKLCVWGIRDKEKLLKLGNDPERIAITGTAVLRHLKDRKEHKGINIVFCPEHWGGGEVEENKRVAKELRKLKGINIQTKIIEWHNSELYDNPVISYRYKPGHLDICAEVLSKADLVVSIIESTFELMAQTMDIPVVVMDEWKPKSSMGDDRYLNYERPTSNAAKRTKLKNLIKTIKQQLANPEELKEKRKIAAINEGGINIKNPTEEIIEVIKSCSKL